jgi:hypothetical protein
VIDHFTIVAGTAGSVALRLRAAGKVYVKVRVSADRGFSKFLAKVEADTALLAAEEAKGGEAYTRVWPPMTAPPLGRDSYRGFFFRPTNVFTPAFAAAAVRKIELLLLAPLPSSKDTLM